jgi:tripartite-type tricarboxylate transporter receptor subunit TctC
MTWRAFAALAVMIVAGCAPFGLAAGAQEFPTRGLKMIVPQPPGGGFDLVGRVTADRLGKVLGQNVVVENRPGTGTLVGTDAAAKAAPDGYTLLVGALPNIVLNVGLYPKLPYNPQRDLTPVGMAVAYSYALVTRKDLPQKTFKDLVAFGKANPDMLTYASGGRGTGQHILMAITSHLAGIKTRHVPYRGAQAAYQDILGGRIDLFFDNVSTAKSLINDGRVGVLASSSKVRHPDIPSVPTLRETGLADFDMETWFGVFTRTGTPAPVLAKLREAMDKVVAAPDFASVFTKTGGIPMKQTAAESEALVRSETMRWLKLMKDASISLQ